MNHSFVVWIFPPVMLVKFWIEHLGLQIRDSQPILLSYSCTTTWVCVWACIYRSHYKKTKFPFWEKCLESMAATKRLKAQTHVKQTQKGSCSPRQQEAPPLGHLSEGREARSRQGSGRNENTSMKWKAERREQTSSFPPLWSLKGRHQGLRNLHLKGCRSPKQPAEASWWVTLRPSGTLLWKTNGHPETKKIWRKALLQRQAKKIKPHKKQSNEMQRTQANFKLSTK